MSINDRMNDAEFNISVPLCKKCRNIKRLKFDSEKPTQYRMKCKIFGEIPKDIAQCKVMECEGFELDEESAFIEFD